MIISYNRGVVGNFSRSIKGCIIDAEVDTDIGFLLATVFVGFPVAKLIYGVIREP